MCLGWIICCLMCLNRIILLIDMFGLDNRLSDAPEFDYKGLFSARQFFSEKRKIWFTNASNSCKLITISVI